MKPFPAGIDDWSHPYHGPDNNPQSQDLQARAPYLTHFLAEPWYCPMPLVTVASGGRLFKAFGHIAIKERECPLLSTLICQSAYNGTILWQRKLSPSFMIHRSTMIATADTLYLADGTSCKRLDAATGEVRDEIVAPKEDGPAWKWMALVDGTLVAMVGQDEVADPTVRGDRKARGWPWGGPLGQGYNSKAYPPETLSYAQAFGLLGTLTALVDDLARAGGTQEAIEHYSDTVVGLARRLSELHPDEADYQRALARNLMQRARLHAGTPRSVEDVKAAVSTVERLAQEQALPWRIDEARSVRQVAEALLKDWGTEPNDEPKPAGQPATWLDPKSIADVVPTLVFNRLLRFNTRLPPGIDAMEQEVFFDSNGEMRKRPLTRRVFHVNLAPLPQAIQDDLAANRYVSVPWTALRAYVRNKVTNETEG